MTKTIQITPATSVALAGSIAKWHKIVQAFKADELYEERGAKDCPLCQIFNQPSARDCGACPVKIDSGDFCEGTPYEQWSDEGNEDGYGDGETQDNAESMHKYLTDLQAKCVVATEEPATPVN